VTETISSMPEQIDQQQLAQQLVEKARADGVDLVGPGGLLTGLTKTVLETALEAEQAALKCLYLVTRRWTRPAGAGPGGRCAGSPP
jgi:hypothetical protein